MISAMTFAQQAARNRLAAELEAQRHPGIDQSAWLAQVAELEALANSSMDGGQMSADKCTGSGQVSAAVTGIQTSGTELDPKVSV